MRQNALEMVPSTIKLYIDLPAELKHKNLTTCLKTNINQPLITAKEMTGIIKRKYYQLHPELDDNLTWYIWEGGWQFENKKETKLLHPIQEKKPSSSREFTNRAAKGEHSVISNHSSTGGSRHDSSPRRSSAPTEREKSSIIPERKRRNSTETQSSSRPSVIREAGGRRRHLKLIRPLLPNEFVMLTLDAIQQYQSEHVNNNNYERNLTSNFLCLSTDKPLELDSVSATATNSRGSSRRGSEENDFNAFKRNVSNEQILNTRSREELLAKINRYDKIEAVELKACARRYIKLVRLVMQNAKDTTVRRSSHQRRPSHSRTALAAI